MKSPTIGLRRDARGMSIVEMLVATLLTTMVIGGLMTMLTSMQFVHEDFDTRTTSYQAARVAMDRIQRDVTLTGVGLTPMLPIFPLVMPRDDGGVVLRHNQRGLVSLLREDMDNAREVPVPAGHGFAAGNVVAVYDASGAIEVATVQNVSGGNLVVSPQLSRTYERAEGASVARVETIQYFVQTVAGRPILMRQIDAETPQPIATDVVAFDIVYLDDSQPPLVFTPDTDIRQLRIRVVDVRLVLETPRDRIQAGDQPTFELRSRITPRALSILRS